MDVWMRQLQSTYPAHRVTRGRLTEEAFLDALSTYPAGAHVGWTLMQATLELNKASHEWNVKGMIPRLEKYLRDGLWQNALPTAAPVAERLSKSTLKTASGAAEFLEDERRGA
jgi:hypothetical protein